MTTLRYLIRMGVEVIDAHLLAAPCPSCASGTARITYAVTRRRLGSKRTEVVQVNDVIACEDDEFCGWSVPAAEVAAA